MHSIAALLDCIGYRHSTQGGARRRGGRLILVGLGVLLLCVAGARRLGSGMAIGLAVASVVAIVVVLGAFLILVAIGMHGFP